MTTIKTCLVVLVVNKKCQGPEARSLWRADVQCDVARWAEEPVCVLVLKGKLREERKQET